MNSFVNLCAGGAPEARQRSEDAQVMPSFRECNMSCPMTYVPHERNTWIQWHWHIFPVASVPTLFELVFVLMEPEPGKRKETG